MARKNTIKLLLINESENEGERLISLFRNAGRVARAQRAQSAEELFSLLEKDSWDLLIADDKHPEINIEQCLEQLKKQKSDLPAIVIRDENVTAALEAGAKDVIARDDESRFIFSALREINHLEVQRELLATKENLNDAEERCELLMAQSQDALAYIGDGMIISTNQQFCACFSYNDPDDLDCAPIIDLINDDDHEKFKAILKSIVDGGKTDWNFTGVKQDGSQFNASMKLSSAVFDEEPCVQISVSERSAPASETNQAASGAVDEQVEDGRSNDEFYIKLETCINLATKGNTNACLLFMGIDDFSAIRTKIGVSKMPLFFADVKNLINAQTKDQPLTLIGRDSFAVLLEDSNIQQAEALAKLLSSELENHIIEINGQSVQCTASIGVLAIDSVQKQDNAASIIDKAFAASEQARETAGGNGIEIFVAEKEKVSFGNATGDEELDTFLEKALEEGQFSLTFQPVVSLRGSSGEHYEVRVLMDNGDNEKLEAKEFINNIQFNSANTRLDRWIILEATKKLAAHIENGHKVSLFLNVTTNTFHDDSLIPWLNVALKAGNIPPSAIIFQFLESDIRDSLKPAIGFSESIKELGCKISVTNFGQASDPLKTLNHIRGDYAKIAGSFTDDIQSGGDTQMLRAMVNSIGECDAQAIISGVENAASLAQLWQIGVDYIQGGYLAGPADNMDYEFTDIA